MRIASNEAWSSQLIELFVLEPRHVSTAYVDWLSDPQVNRFLESRFERHTLDTTRDFVKACADSEHTLFLGIRYRELGGQHVGNIKLEMNRRHGLAEVGILIGERAAHGKGIATEAIRMVSQIARAQLAVRKLTAGCYASNGASERAFLKAGFCVEGRRPEHFLLEGRPEALTLLGLIL